MKNFTVSVFRLRHKDKSGKRQVAFRVRSKHIKRNSLDLLPKYFWYQGSFKFTDYQYETLKAAGYYGEIIDCKTNIEKYCRKLVASNTEISKDALIEEFRKSRTQEHAPLYNQFLQNQDLKIKPEDFKRFEAIEDLIIDNPYLNEEDDSLEIYLENYIQSVEDEKKRLNYLQQKRSNNFTQRLHADYEYLGNEDENLLISIGGLFLKNKPNGSYEYPKQYRGILKELYDFLITTEKPNKVASIDQQFFIDLLLYIRDAGIIKTSLNRTPHELDSGLYDSRFLDGERYDCSHDTFKGKVKAVNKLVKMCRNHLNINLNFNEFKATDFINTTAPKTGVRVQERLEVTEVLELLEKDFQSEEINKTRDLFLILIFCGGLRGIKNNEISFRKNDGYLLVLHHKTKTPIESPICDELRVVLERNLWSVPEIPEDTIVVNLRAIASTMNWNREVLYINTKINRKPKDGFYERKKLSDCISQKFARKTFVHYMRMKYGLSDRDIIEYTGHASIETLQHYSGAPSILERKKKLMQSQ